MGTQTRTQVAIIGGGPAGLLLSHILHLSGVESIVLERQTKAYVLSRIRAGVLEFGTTDLLRQMGLGERMDREGHVHAGIHVTWHERDPFTIDTETFTGRPMMAYGQTAITEDLYTAREAADAQIIEEAVDVALHDVTSDAPYVTYEKDGQSHRIDCDFIAGCDGFHGVSRKTMPDTVKTTFEKIYPFGWLGIMSETPPLPEIMYAYHPKGFALASQRSPMLSRYYVQCPNSDTVDDWSDDRFWSELTARFPKEIADQIVTGPSIEKSIAPLRSFVCEPMQYGKLYLAGDAAHIVPPTGAKGLNLAVSDVYYLSRGLIEHYKNGDDAHLSAYSDTALDRVWSAVRLSWWLTTLLHVFPDEEPFQTKIRDNDYAYLMRSKNAQATLAEQFVGLPYDA